MIDLKPIIFGTEMIKAILEGQKTVTRRVVKLPKNIIKSGNGLYTLLAEGDTYYNQGIEALIEKGYIRPRYNIGDILCVRETWCIHDLNSPAFCMMIKYKADDSTALQVEFEPDRFERFKKFYYKKGWQSPQFMPKEAARIFLNVVDVRAERVQDITQEQAEKEMSFDCMKNLCAGFTGDYLTAFEILWDKINKKRVYGWEANPMVWVYEFEKIEKPTTNELEHSYEVGV